VLRSWLADGTVMDATRLSEAQIEAYIAMRERTVPRSETERDRAVFTEVESAKVPESELLDPPENVRLSIPSRTETRKRRSGLR
jgi:hypothetical protein